jgi:hypothetical protein
MVNLHFLGLLEALLECKSAVLNKLMPVWSPVLHSHHLPVSALSKILLYTSSLNIEDYIYVLIDLATRPVTNEITKL